MMITAILYQKWNENKPRCTWKIKFREPPSTWFFLYRCNLLTTREYMYMENVRALIDVLETKLINSEDLDFLPWTDHTEVYILSTQILISTCHTILQFCLKMDQIVKRLHTIVPTFVLRMWHADWLTESILVPTKWLRLSTLWCILAREH